MPTPSATTTWFGFYPHRPLYARSQPDYAALSALEISRTLAESVFSFDTPTATMRVCRDGLCLVSFKTTYAARTIKEHLNCLYVLLSSHAADYKFESFLPLTELTLEDILVCHYAGDRLVQAELDGVNERTRTQFLTRYLTTHLPIQPSKFDFIPGGFWDKLGKATHLHAQPLQIRNNRVLPEAVYRAAATDYTRLSTDSLFVSILASLTQSLGHYETKNYAESLIFSWFVIEAYLYELYARKVARAQPEESLSASVLIRELKTARILPYEVGNDLHTIRLARNRVVHDKFRTSPDPAPAALAIEALKEFIRRDVGLNLNLPLA